MKCIFVLSFYTEDFSKRHYAGFSQISSHIFESSESQCTFENFLLYYGYVEIIIMAYIISMRGGWNPYLDMEICQSYSKRTLLTILHTVDALIGFNQHVQ